MIRRTAEVNRSACETADSAMAFPAMDRLAAALRYLWRHRIVQVGAAYVVTSWALIQVVTLVAQTWNLEAWVPRVALVLLALGFPLAMILAWAWGGGADRPAQGAAPSAKGAAVGRAPRAGTIAVLP